MPTVLVVGGGGREHALVHALESSPSHPRVLVAPGNAGTRERLPISATDIDGLVAAAQTHEVDLVVVGPEAPLVGGLANRLRENGIAVLGPSSAAAQLEGSKAFAKQIMHEAGVPTARWGTFERVDDALEFAEALGGRAVVKADGLAGGKGVIVPQTPEETQQAIRQMLEGSKPANSIVVEELLTGEELSVIALCDGHRISVLAPSQDHKRVGEGDEGPNTGGMGAYSPAPKGTDELLRKAEEMCLRPVVERMRQRGTPFSGILYAGLMLTDDGPKVLEYNVRFGDPEAQVVLPRLEDDAYLLFESAAKGGLPDGPVSFSSRAALTVVLASEGYPASPRTGDIIEGVEEASALEDVLVFQAGTQLSGDRIVTSGGRVLGVTGLGDDLAAAAAHAYAAVGRIQWPGLHYRRDIGYRALGYAPGAR